MENKTPQTILEERLLRMDITGDEIDLKIAEVEGVADELYKEFREDTK